MLDALIDRQNRHVSGAAKPPVIDQLLQARKHPSGPIGERKDSIDGIRTRQMERLLRNRLARVIEQLSSIAAQDRFDIVCGLQHGSPRLFRLSRGRVF
jgi:hypothetical protein